MVHVQEKIGFWFNNEGNNLWVFSFLKSVWKIFVMEISHEEDNYPSNALIFKIRQDIAVFGPSHIEPCLDRLIKPCLCKQCKWVSLWLWQLLIHNLMVPKPHSQHQFIRKYKIDVSKLLSVPDRFIQNRIGGQNPTLSLTDTERKAWQLYSF